MLKTAVQQGLTENFLIFHISLKGSGRGYPLLRVVNEHSYIVRVLRTRRAPGRLLSLSILLKCEVEASCEALP